MKIEWNKITLFSKLIVITTFVLTFFIGFYVGKETIKLTSFDKVTEVTINNIINSNLIKDGKYCFSRIQVATESEPYKAKEYIVLNIKDNLVTGTKDGIQSGPDMTNGYHGDLNGNIDDNILELTYSYIIEGSDGKELETYKFENNTLIKMRWPLVDKNKILTPDKTEEPKLISYPEEKCL